VSGKGGGGGWCPAPVKGHLLNSADLNVLLL
jgi:hypothetical protein